MDLEKKLLHPEEKIRNYPLYYYRLLCKLFFLVVFGIGTIFLSIMVIPSCKLLLHPKSKYRYYIRFIAHKGLAGIAKIIRALGFMSINVDKEDILKGLRSAIVVSNHPAYADSFVMVALLPHTSIIPKTSLSKRNIFQILMKEIYMPNSMPFEEMLERAKDDFENGNTLLIYPEGTRSTPYGQNYYKKGAARLSLATGVPIIPVYIGGNAKKGMGKGDKILEVNPTRQYIYNLYVKEPVYPSEFKDLPEPIAAKRFTQKLHTILSDEANAQYRY